MGRPRKHPEQRVGRRKYPGEDGYRPPQPSYEPDPRSSSARTPEQWAAEAICLLRLRAARVASNPLADDETRAFGESCTARADRMERQLRDGTLRYPRWLIEGPSAR